MKLWIVALIGLGLGLGGGYALALVLPAQAARPTRSGSVVEQPEAAPAPRVQAPPQQNPGPDPELEALRKENAELKGQLAQRAKPEPGKTAGDEPKAAPPPPPAGDEARELRERLGREPSAEELAELQQRLAQQRQAEIDAQARRIAEREAAAAALKDNDAVGLLRNLKEITPEVRAVVKSREAFESWFERKITGPAMDGATISKENPVVDGATVRFGPGKQKWSVSHLGRGKEVFPKDVLVVGAGRDQTLLSVDEFSADSDIRSLTFQDLTLDCANNYMSDMRGPNGSTIRFERCRIVRFDMGAGGSVMLSSRGGVAFYATDTVITCGYGRSPGSGQVFRVQGALLVRMERCTVEGPMYGLFSSGGVAAYCFVECAFTNVRDLYALPAKPEDLGASFENCSFAGSREAKAVQLKLTDINPDWITE